MKYFYTLFFTIAGIFLFSQSPGGVSGVSLWLKADSVASPGLIYEDYSGNVHQIFAPEAANKPSYSLLNYNETLFFDGGQHFLKIPYVMETLEKISLFTVYQDYNIARESALLTTDKSGEKELFYSTANLSRYNNEQINYIDPSKTDSIATFAMYSKFDIPSKNIGEVVGNSGQSSLYIGKDVGSRKWASFKGKLPEFFIYRKILTQNERDRVESYLAVKYGITMPLTEYLSSKSIKIWKKEDYTDYPNNIAGIARDSYSELYQKQASSTSEEKRLIIAAHKIALSNKENTSDFANQTFLIWGNDNNPLELDEENFGTQLFKRRWKTRYTAESAVTVPVEVAVSVKDIVPQVPADKNIWLLIDRSGSGNFNSASIDAYPAVNIDSKGNAIFKNIEFDKDLNGADVFTFGLGSKLLSVQKLVQPTCTNPSGSLDLNIKGGVAPYTINLKGSKNNIPISVTAQSPQVTFANLAIDSYTAQIKDALGAVSNFVFSINDFDTMNLDLGSDQKMKAGEYIELDASKNITDTSASYSWTSDNGFTSSLPKIKIYDAGKYSVTVTTADGCSKSSSINITKSTEKGIFIYPNPTSVGEPFTIKIILDDVGDVGIRIFDMSGRLLRSLKESGKSYYEVKEVLYSKGVYVIIVDTPSDKKVFKLIIN